jgi:hypothetical protein
MFYASGGGGVGFQAFFVDFFPANSADAKNSFFKAV